MDYILNSASVMVFHFGCELHEPNSFSHMLANGCKTGGNEDKVERANAENNEL